MLSLSTDCCSQSCYVYRYKGYIIRADSSLVLCTAWPLRAALPQLSECHVLEYSCLPVLMMIPGREQCTLDFASKYLYVRCSVTAVFCQKTVVAAGSWINSRKGSWDFLFFEDTAEEEHQWIWELLEWNAPQPRPCLWKPHLYSYSPKPCLATVAPCPVTFRTDKFFDHALCLYSGN